MRYVTAVIPKILVDEVIALGYSIAANRSAGLSTAEVSRLVAQALSSLNQPAHLCISLVVPTPSTSAALQLPHSSRLFFPLCGPRQRDHDLLEAAAPDALASAGSIGGVQS